MKTEEVVIRLPYRTDDAHCRNCPEPVAWVQSNRTGGWYLADALIERDKVIPMKHKPHYLSCKGESNGHEVTTRQQSGR